MLHNARNVYHDSTASAHDVAPFHIHDCAACEYHGSIVIGSEAIDVYTHRNGADDVGVILRLSACPPDYTSFTVPTISAAAQDAADDAAEMAWWEKCERGYYASKARPKLPGGPIAPGGRPGARID